VEYGMIRYAGQFYQMNDKTKAAILKQITKVAVEIEAGQ
jgi:hypothetical protein